MLHGFGQGVTNLGQTLSRKKEIEAARKYEKEQDAKRAKERRKERLSDRDFQLKVRGTDAEAKRIKDRQTLRAKGETAESQMRRRDLAAQAKDLAQTERNEGDLDWVVGQVILGNRKAPNPQVSAMAAAKVQKGFSSPGPEDEHDKLYQKWIKDEVPDGELTPRQIQRFETRFKKETREKDSKKADPMSREALWSNWNKMGELERDNFGGNGGKFLIYVDETRKAYRSIGEPDPSQPGRQPGGDVAKYTAQHQEIFGGGQPAMPATGQGGIDYYNALLTQNQQGAGEEGVGDALPEIGGEEDDGAIDITDMMNPGARFDPTQDSVTQKADSLLSLPNKTPEQRTWLRDYLEYLGLVFDDKEQ